MPEERRSRKKMLTWLQSHNINSFFSYILVFNIYSREVVPFRIKQGISAILIRISSLNEGSIRFHARNGFSECGRFKKAEQKKGMVFDTDWMQKFI